MNDQQYDLIVVGGGVAGATLATGMARVGARVLVLERETEFRDRVRGEWLAPWGVAEARTLGILDTVVEAGAHRLPELVGRSGKPRPVVSPAGDVPLTFFHPVLQEAIVHTAIASGATVVRGARVTQVEGGPVPRVHYVGDDSRANAPVGRLVVGADGRSSVVRAALGRPHQVHRGDRILAGVRIGGIQGDPSVGYFIVSDDAGGLVSLFPQGAGYARGYVFITGADAREFSGPGGFERFVAASIDMGVPAEALAAAFAAGPLAAFVASDTWVESPAGNGLALIGDAAGISDPTWGMGLGLALRDARTLTEALLAEQDWNAAAATYAAERDRYFQTIVTAENWQSELQLTAGPEATARRKHALRLWSREPDRAIDLPGLGPGVDVSAEARRRFFGEDIPMESGQPQAPAGEQSNQGRSGDEAVADAFLGALRARDFDALQDWFSPTVRTRALLPGGPAEFHGSTEATGAFIGWFQDVGDFAVDFTGYERVADRLQMRWRFSLRLSGEGFMRTVEQTAYAKIVDGRIAVLDVLCSGFRPGSSPASASSLAAA